MARNALFYGIKPSKFAYLCFGNSDEWKADIDVYLPTEMQQLLSTSTGAAEDVIHKTTLMGSCDYFYSPTGKTPQVKWVMPLGVRAKKRKHYGLQFCPCCLNEDGDKPYFRKHWRLAYFTACPFHSVQLHDKCPQCKSPINIKRLQKHTKKILYHPVDICHCSNCGFDLRKSDWSAPLNDELEINRQHFNLYTNGYGSVGNQIFNYSNLYFEGLRRLLSLLICHPQDSRLYQYLAHELDAEVSLKLRGTLHDLEPDQMNLKDRKIGLIEMSSILKEWPTSFIKAALESNTTTQDIYSPYLYFPYWINDVVRFSISMHK